MNKGIVIFLLVTFSLYTAYTMAIADQSLLAFGYQLMSSPDTAQVVYDLYIMAILAIAWMYQDTKQRNKPLIYWLVFSLITLVFVSIGPLLYLALRAPQQKSEHEI